MKSGFKLAGGLNCLCPPANIFVLQSLFARQRRALLDRQSLVDQLFAAFDFLGKYLV